MTFYTKEKPTDYWMGQLRNAGVGDVRKSGRNKKSELMFGELLRETIVPFYNLRHDDTIVLLPRPGQAGAAAPAPAPVAAPVAAGAAAPAPAPAPARAPAPVAAPVAAGAAAPAPNPKRKGT